MCMSVFWLDEEVTSTLCPVNSVHTSHSPAGSRGPHSVWSGAAPWLIYFLPWTTAVRGGQHLQGLPEGRETDKLRVSLNLQGITNVYFYISSPLQTEAARLSDPTDLETVVSGCTVELQYEALVMFEKLNQTCLIAPNKSDLENHQLHSLQDLKIGCGAVITRYFSVELRIICWLQDNYSSYLNSTLIGLSTQSYVYKEVEVVPVKPLLCQMFCLCCKISHFYICYLYCPIWKNLHLFLSSFPNTHPYNWVFTSLPTLVYS